MTITSSFSVSMVKQTAASAARKRQAGQRQRGVQRHRRNMNFAQAHRGQVQSYRQAVWMRDQAVAAAQALTDQIRRAESEGNMFLSTSEDLLAHRRMTRADGRALRPVTAMVRNSASEYYARGLNNMNAAVQDRIARTNLHNVARGHHGTAVRIRTQRRPWQGMVVRNPWDNLARTVRRPRYTARWTGDGPDPNLPRPSPSQSSPPGSSFNTVRCHSSTSR